MACDYRRRGRSGRGCYQVLIFSPLSSIPFRFNAAQTDDHALSSNTQHPLVTNSIEELIKTLVIWMADHNGERPPASLVYRLSSVNNQFPHKVQLSMGSKVAQARRFQIDKKWMAWVIEDSNGNCILAKPQGNSHGGWQGFQAWLGGERGFTAANFARTIMPAKRVAVSSDEHSGSDDDAADRKSTSISRSLRFMHHLIDPRRLKDDVARKPPRHRRRTLRDQIPIDYKVPTAILPSARESKTTNRYSHSAKVRRRFSRLSSRSSHSSSQSVVSVSGMPVTSSHPDIAEQETAHTPSSSGDPLYAANSRLIALDPPTQSQATLFQATTPASSMNTSTNAVSKVVFHFFLSNADLGAIPKDLTHCNTLDLFFDEAFAAWNILGDGGINTRMSAVSVTTLTSEWPIVIPWKNKDSFERMLEIVNNLTMGKTEPVHAKVKCIESGQGKRA